MVGIEKEESYYHHVSKQKIVESKYHHFPHQMQKV